MQRNKMFAWGTLVLGAMLSFGPRPAFSQQAGSVPPGLARLAQALGLTPDQQTKIVNIRLGARAQAQAVAANPSLSAQDKAAQIAAIRAAVKPQVLAVLTPDQQAKLASLHSQGGTAGPGAPGIAQALNLTPDQQAKIVAIRTNARAQVQAVMANSSLSAQDKATQIAAIRAAAKAQLLAVLTPEQQQKLAALRPR